MVTKLAFLVLILTAALIGVWYGASQERAVLADIEAKQSKLDEHQRFLDELIEWARLKMEGLNGRDALTE